MDVSPDVFEALTALARESLEACDAVLARVWIVDRGDLCSTCAMRSECPDRSRCLHLVISEGLTRRVDGPFRRFPLGARRVARVATERIAYLERGAQGLRDLAEHAWLALHEIRSFAAVPLGPSGHGVLAVFSRSALTDAEVRLLALAARAALKPHVGLPATPAGTARPGVLRGRTTALEPELVASPASPPRTLAEIQRQAIEKVLAETGGKISGPRGAATILGLKPSTLVSRMQRLGVRRPPR